MAPPSPGVLFVSLLGDKTRLKRRADAQNALRAPRHTMQHQLRLILEGQHVPVGRRGPIAALTPAVKRKVFGERSPTATQERALRVALNTPDVALIQGPPGTGKTTIIVALVERLQEIWDASDGVQGRLLLTGFQHDAVENAIQRMNVNGLPPIKFGGRQNRREDADRVDATIDRWSSERGAAIRALLPARPASALQDELATVVEAYLLAPGTLEQTAALLARVADGIRPAVPAALTDRIRTLGRELSDRVRLARHGDPLQERVLLYVRALRCDARSFADDGARNAFRLAQELLRTGRLDSQTQKVLDAAAAWATPEAPPFLDELRSLRRRLLLKLLPADRTNDAIPRARTEVLEVLTTARDELDRRHRGSRDAADEAVLSFLAALEGDPEAVKQAVISYTSVFAATCQQSARHELAQLKGSTGYDTVVVDEAARANPLDLFVPLAQAQRRIVLVGDHRQLPHIVDDEVLEELLSSEKKDDEHLAAMLNESLFERLFNDLREREARDGIPRTVTLDEQYRMHPTLGRFLSEQFYAAHGEAFGSPRPAAEFVHALPDYEGPAAWLSVPARLGAETHGQSKSRAPEASAIVSELKRLMDSEGGRKLTFGVISFYKAQVGLIRQALESAGMVFRTEDDGTDIAEPYRELRLDNGRSAERLRFGTVDAFQGMEFDVVFLSMVRSNTHSEASEKDRRKRFGHLMSPNRLCVAMSRQKRLLIVAGDDGMLRSPQAATAIGPLVQFRKLSEVRDAARL